jgi:hypothetical protein
MSQKTIEFQSRCSEFFENVSNEELNLFYSFLIAQMEIEGQEELVYHLMDLATDPVFKRKFLENGNRNTH